MDATAKRELMLKFKEIEMKIANIGNEINKKKTEQEKIINNLMQQQSKANLVYASRQQEIQRYSQQLPIRNNTNEDNSDNNQTVIEQLKMEIQQMQSKILEDRKFIENLSKFY